MTFTHMVELEPWLAGLVIFYFVLGVLLAIQYGISLWLQARKLLNTADTQAEAVCAALLTMPVEQAQECAAELRKTDPAMYILVTSKLQGRKR